MDLAAAGLAVKACVDVTHKTDRTAARNIMTALRFLETGPIPLFIDNIKVVVIVVVLVVVVFVAVLVVPIRR